MKLRFENAVHYKKEIQKLYSSAFPRKEQAPLFYLYYKARKGQADFRAVTDGGRLVGLIYTADGGPSVTLMFFAVAEAERGKGYGSRILKFLRKKYRGRRIFLNIESLDPSADNYADRVRRKGFYEKNQFRGMGYTVREGGVRYEVLSLGGPVSKTEYERFSKNFFGRALYFLIRNL